MKEKHFIITLCEDFTVSKTRGVINRNSNSTQWLDVELDDWKLNEGEELFIELSHKKDEYTTHVGPLYLVFNPGLKRYVTLIPPEVFTVPGTWEYSLELRFNIGESDKSETTTKITTVTDKDGKVVSSTTVVSGGESKSVITYNSITSERYSFQVIDSIITSTGANTYVKETELISAARAITDAILLGHNAEELLEVAAAARQSELNAAESENKAAASAELAESARLNAEDSAEAAAASASEAAQSADIAQTAASQAAEAASQAEQSAMDAENAKEAAEQSVTEAATSAQNSAASATAAEEAKEAAHESALTAKDWADIAKSFAEFGIKINTDYSSVDELPETGNPQYIYLIPNGSEGNNSYDEYMWVTDKNAYEKIGTTEIDLTAHATKIEVADGLAEKVSKDGDAMTGDLYAPTLAAQSIYLLAPDQPVQLRGNKEQDGILFIGNFPVVDGEDYASINIIGSILDKFNRAIDTMNITVVRLIYEDYDDSGEAFYNYEILISGYKTSNIGNSLDIVPRLTNDSINLYVYLPDYASVDLICTTNGGKLAREAVFAEGIAGTGLIINPNNIMNTIVEIK